MAEEEPTRNSKLSAHPHVQPRDRAYRRGKPELRNAWGKNDARPGSDVVDGCGNDCERSQEPIKPKQAERVLTQIVNHAKSAFSPSQGDQTAPNDAVLLEAMLFYRLPEFQVIDHMHAQGAICSKLLVRAATNQIESAGTYVIASSGIFDFPGPH